MMRIALLVWQVAGPDGQPLPPPALSVVPRCPRDEGGDDVVVCGRLDPDRYRLKPLPPRYAPRDALPAAKVSLGGGTLSAEAGQGDVGGVASNRAMLKWKLAF